MDYKDYIENIPNFPIEGIQYKDIQPLLKHSYFESIKDMGELVEIQTIGLGLNQEDLYLSTFISFWWWS